jgi:hypothetical protein
MFCFCCLYQEFVYVVLNDRALRKEHLDFDRDRDGMDLKTSVLGRDRLGCNFFGIVLGFSGIFRDFKILFEYAFIHYESEHLWSLIFLLTDNKNCSLSTCGSIIVMTDRQNHEVSTCGL